MSVIHINDLSISLNNFILHVIKLKWQKLIKNLYIITYIKRHKNEFIEPLSPKIGKLTTIAKETSSSTTVAICSVNSSFTT